MVSSKAILVGFGVLAVSLFQPCLAAPFSSDATLAQTTPSYDSGLFRRAEPQNFYLRIMPLGASITAGEHEPEDDEGEEWLSEVSPRQAPLGGLEGQHGRQL